MTGLPGDGRGTPEEPPRRLCRGTGACRRLRDAAPPSRRAQTGVRRARVARHDQPWPQCGGPRPPASRGSGFRLLIDGRDSFSLRLRLADAAERTLDVQYFVLQQDDTGQLLLQALLQAADRGVRVRLLLDDAEAFDAESMIRPLAAHPNIHIRIYNPFVARRPLAILRGAEYLLEAGRSTTGCTTSSSSPTTRSPSPVAATSAMRTSRPARTSHSATSTWPWPGRRCGSCPAASTCTGTTGWRCRSRRCRWASPPRPISRPAAPRSPRTRARWRSRPTFARCPRAIFSPHAVRHGVAGMGQGAVRLRPAGQGAGRFRRRTGHADVEQDCGGGGDGHRGADHRVAVSRAGGQRDGTAPAPAAKRRARAHPHQFAGVDRHAHRACGIHPPSRPAAGAGRRALRSAAVAGAAGGERRTDQAQRFRPVRAACEGLRHRSPAAVPRVDELRPALAAPEHRDRPHRRQPGPRKRGRRTLRGDRAAGEQLPSRPRTRRRRQGRCRPVGERGGRQDVEFDTEPGVDAIKRVGIESLSLLPIDHLL